MTSDSERYDAIVIGSGIGGLTCASLLAQLRGLRVLVLERHWRLGGFTHAFTRPHAGPWPVGLHYVGQMSDGGTIRAIMDMVTADRVGWSQLPTPFERYHFPGFVADQPSDADAWTESLMERWPRQRDAVARYFAAVDETFAHFATRLLPWRSAAEYGSEQRPGRSTPLASLTTREALDAIGVSDLELRAALTAQWGNYGLPPGRSSFISHAIVAHHFRDGGWFPRSGAGAIASAAQAMIEAAGGACRVSHNVDGITVERDRAVGVRAAYRTGRNAERREYFAPLIISDAGAYATYATLIPENTAHRADALAQMTRGGIASSALQLFLGLGGSPDLLGARGENHWMFDGIDHDRLFARRNDIIDGYAGSAFLSFPSMSLCDCTQHTAAIVAPFDYSVIARWKERRWRRRGRQYDEMKQRIASTLVAFVERYLPGLGTITTYSELATPLTVEQFTGHHAGAIYGLPSAPERFTASFLRVATPLRGLLLTGADVGAPGIVGALMGAVATVGHILGPGGMQRIIAAARHRAAGSITVHSVRDPTAESARPAI